MASDTPDRNHDHVLGRLIQEAGNVAAEPRPEHVDDLRRRLLARTEPAARRRSRWTIVSTVAGTAIAAALLIAVLLAFTSKPSVAWADALAASRARPWIHGTTTVSDGKQSREMEFWIAPKRGIFAVRHQELVALFDRQLEVSTRFVPSETRIYRAPALETGSSLRQDFGDVNLFERILLDEAEAGAAFPDEDVVRSKRKELTEDERRWIEYSFTLKRRYEPLTKRNLVVRVDARSKLLHSCTIHRLDGPTPGGIPTMFTTEFDFPETGPLDIYDLGVPRSAEIVDRVPRGDLARILAGMKTARRRFEDYDAMVVQHTEGREATYSDLRGLSVRRVRRRGDRLRVDMLLTAKPDLQAPGPDDDIGRWWLENRDDYYSVPLQVCDGKVVYFFLMVDDRLPADGPPNTAVELTSKRALRPPVDDPPVEWPQLMPEHYCRPQLWASDVKREIALETAPDDGPEGTVRLIVRQSAGPYGRPAGERCRYWVDIDRDHAVRKSVSKVFMRQSPEIAYVETVEFEEFAESPGGIAYSTRVRRLTSNSEVVQVTDFYLDFDADLPDEIFRPVEPSSD